MKCPKCRHSQTKVVESRDVSESSSVRRRRECLECAERWTTYERIEQPNLVVVKKDGTRQMFNRGKLMTGLTRACEKTSVTSLELEQLVADIENQLYQRGDQEVPSTMVGQMVMNGLAQLSEVAYVRFASVYRSFRDIENFEQELSRLRGKTGKKQPLKSTRT